MVKNTELSTYESVVSERDHIEHPDLLKSIDSQQNRENYDRVDTDIELGSNTEV